MCDLSVTSVPQLAVAARCHRFISCKYLGKIIDIRYPACESDRTDGLVGKTQHFLCLADPPGV